MHLDLGSLVCGLMLGSAAWQLGIGVSLIRRGTYQPRAWGNPHLSARSQGHGFLLISATFAVAGLGYLVALPLGGAALVIGLLTVNLHGRRVQRRAEHHAAPSATTDPIPPTPPTSRPDLGSSSGSAGSDR